MTQVAFKYSFVFLNFSVYVARLKPLTEWLYIILSRQRRDLNLISDTAAQRSDSHRINVTNLASERM